ncbi:uncharacterized protein BJ212DRAFT_1297959 [Suillus subaureus]|uniref:Uncharacterized protein n=1 Tax=Suillus subaureus TaxID=48587 RepID=A0A9P7EGL1_9AGAM|nr:uncharacterized protein BJ212DRAFT_1297959 [Suillus subaureus]KAG1820600.1 hypothetical protein BJ212DRAFT_1297959 [Suillus subaureus]
MYGKFTRSALFFVGPLPSFSLVSHNMETGSERLGTSLKWCQGLPCIAILVTLTYSSAVNSQTNAGHAPQYAGNIGQSKGGTEWRRRENKRWCVTREAAARANKRVWQEGLQAMRKVARNKKGGGKTREVARNERGRWRACEQGKKWYCMESKRLMTLWVEYDVDLPVVSDHASVYILTTGIHHLQLLTQSHSTRCFGMFERNGDNALILTSSAAMSDSFRRSTMFRRRDIHFNDWSMIQGNIPFEGMHMNLPGALLHTEGASKIYQANEYMVVVTQNSPPYRHCDGITTNLLLFVKPTVFMGLMTWILRTSPVGYKLVNFD